MVALLNRTADSVTASALARLRQAFSDRAYLALAVRRQPHDANRLRDLAALASAARVPIVETGDVQYYTTDGHLLQDVVTCIREKCTIDDLSPRRERIADRHLTAPQKMARLFRRYLSDTRPVHRSIEFASRCTFSLRCEDGFEPSMRV